MNRPSSSPLERRRSLKRGALNRRDFISRAGMGMCAIIGGTQLALIEAMQSSVTEVYDAQAFPSQQHFIQHLKYKLGVQFVDYRFAPEESRNPPVTRAQILKTLWTGGKKLLCVGNDLCVETEETAEEIIEVAQESAEYVFEYQQPRDETPGYLRDELECNDDAGSACKTLDKPGVPMYFLSILPHHPEDRFDEDWHQMATCKLDRERYVIIDNNAAVTVWEGSLASFVYSYGGDVQMGIVPSFGIARYATPKHKNGLSKMLVHAGRSIAHEDQMEWVKIERERGMLV